jgi:putative membrane protein
MKEQATQAAVETSQQQRDSHSEQAIKCAILLDQSPLQAEPEAPLKSAVTLQEPAKWQEVAVNQISYEEKPPSVEKRRRSVLGRWFGYLSAGILLLSIAELGLFIVELSQREDWLAGLWLVLSIGLLILIGATVVGEWRGMRQLKRQETFRESSLQLFDVPAIGMGKAHCLALAASMPQEYQQDLSLWQSKLAEHHTDSEVLSLFEQSIVAKADKNALAIISNNAGAAGVMIAVSPFALLDMAIVLWRNIRMLNQISEAYGVRLGYWGRMSLIRKVFHTMLYAGAGEIISDAGNYALGAGLSGKLSSRVAQGMGAGVLSARIGLKAMQECRPMPWLATDQPKLATISKQLMADLSKHLN